MLERDMGGPGPQFERVDDEVLFRYVVDPSNVIGPRAATEKDRVDHPGAWAEFEANERGEVQAAPPTPKKRQAKK